MTDLERYLELERLEYMGDVETNHKTLGDKINRIDHDQAERGLLRSGQTLHLILQAHAESSRELALKRIARRKRLGAKAPPLLSDNELDKLQEDLEKGAHAAFQWLHEEFRKRNLAAGIPADASATAANRVLRNAAPSEVALIRREIYKLKLERGLGVENKHESGSIVMNISNSTISGLNLGTIVGDINATLNTLEQRGNTELAGALKALSEAIAANEQLGIERR